MSSLQLSKTVPLRKVLEKVKEDPLYYFEKYPLDVVRNECLNVMVEGRHPRVYNDQAADWAEEWISFFLEDSETMDYNTAEKLLNWYLLSSCEEREEVSIPLAVRAVGFAIELTSQHYFVGLDGKITKLIISRLLKSDGSEIYPKIPNIKIFLKNKLIGIFGYEVVRRIKRGKADCEIRDNEYSHSDWIEFERALKIVLRMKDYHFIRILDEAFQFLLEGTIIPSFGYLDPLDPSLIRSFHIMIIEHSIKRLGEDWQEAIKEGISDKLESVQSLLEG